MLKIVKKLYFFQRPSLKIIMKIYMDNFSISLYGLNINPKNDPSILKNSTKQPKSFSNHNQ